MRVYHSARASIGRLPAASRGALWMVGACASFAVMMALVRLVSADVHPFVAAFFRNVFGLVFMLPWVLHAGRRSIRTRRWGMHGLRAAFGLAAMLCLFFALSKMPLAEATALTFTAPLFATVGAALLLGEKVRARRWTAIAVGLAGVLVILRPGVAAVQPAALVALAAAAFIAAAMLTIKSLSRTEHPNAIVVIMGLLMTPGSLPPAILTWTTPDEATFGWLALMGLAATMGQVCLTRAFRAADASAVMSLDFSRLIFVSILGYLMFGQAPDLWTWAGGAVILSSSVYIARRETRIGRRTLPPAAPAP
jgi:drug/metabolite transporter (DMT)-like permease